MIINELIKEAKELPLVPLIASTAYQEKISDLVQFVDDTMLADSSLQASIDNNSLSKMLGHHRHHASFMLLVLSTGNYELLARTIPWAYRLYASQNLSYDYIRLELNSWLLALDKHIDSQVSKEIRLIHSWILKMHEDMISVSQTDVDLCVPNIEKWLARKISFFAALLAGNHRQCLEIAVDSVSTAKELEYFYLLIIQPVMYEVGMLWERGVISIAEEHLASAIVSRVMAAIYMLDIEPVEFKGKAVITAAPNEFHEIGAWMISDVLENEGWQVRYLGANTPQDDLLGMLRTFQPDILGLSVTMSFNIPGSKEIIARIKNELDLQDLKIMVGGRVFNETENLWSTIGADGCAAHLQAAKDLADTWKKR